MSFLRAGTLSSTLQALSLGSSSSHSPRLSFEELRHVESIEALKKLRVRWILATPFLPEQEDAVLDYPPSHLLPLLQACCIEEEED